MNYEQSPFEQDDFIPDPPDTSKMSLDELCAMLLLTGGSKDPGDQVYAKACREELAKRK